MLTFHAKALKDPGIRQIGTSHVRKDSGCCQHQKYPPGPPCWLDDQAKQHANY